MANPLPLIYSAWRCDCFRQIIQGEDVYRGDDRLPGCANVLATCVTRIPFRSLRIVQRTNCREDQGFASARSDAAGSCRDTFRGRAGAVERRLREAGFNHRRGDKPERILSGRLVRRATFRRVCTSIQALHLALVGSCKFCVGAVPRRVDRMVRARPLFLRPASPIRNIGFHWWTLRFVTESRHRL